MTARPTNFQPPKLPKLSHAGKLTLEKIHVCTQVSQWEHGQKIYYWYIATTAIRLAQLKEYLQQDNFDREHVCLFGHIIAEGGGTPHDELKEYMATYYGYQERKRPIIKAPPIIQEAKTTAPKDDKKSAKKSRLIRWLSSIFLYIRRHLSGDST